MPLVKTSLENVLEFAKSCLTGILNLEFDASVREINFGSFSEFKIDTSKDLIGIDFSMSRNNFNGFGLLLFSKDDIRVIFSKIIGMEISEDDFELDVVARESVFELFGKIFLAIKDGIQKKDNKPWDIRAENVFVAGEFTKHNRRFQKNEIVRVVINFSVTTMINSEFHLFLPCDLLLGSKQKKMKTKSVPETGFEPKQIEEELKQQPEEPYLPQAEEPVENFAAVGLQEVSKKETETVELINESNENRVSENAFKSLQKSERKNSMQDFLENDNKKNAPGSYPQNLKKGIAYGEEVKAVDLVSLQEEESQQSNMDNLKLVMGIPVQVSVELGRVHKKVKEVLEYGRGTIIQLDKHAGAQVDVIINGQKIAKGDVVVVDENFGVRITEIAKSKDLRDIL
jgi:flagellar motor switch protein FliN/FliY